MKPLATVEEVYAEPIVDKSNVIVDFEQSEDSRRVILDLGNVVRDIVNAKRESLGFSGIRPIDMSTRQAEQLRSAIKTDSAWIETYKALVDTLSPDLAVQSLDDQLAAINIPWWNCALLFRENDVYDSNGKLKIQAQMSHSYITQLTRARKVDSGTDVSKNDSMSVSNVLFTADGLIVLGLRGGHSYANTIMTVPAGSIQYHTGENPLFETLSAEFFEELSLSDREIVSTELVGRSYENTISNSSMYVFRSMTNLSFPELQHFWLRSKDQREHKFLIPLLDHPLTILDQIEHNRYDPEKADQRNPSATTIENINTVLPSGAVSLLLHCAQREGMSWASKAEGILNDSYGFLYLDMV